MPLNEPQFATVSFLLGDTVEGTFRVPIADETTVRRLAKDAIRRLISRHCNGQHPITRGKVCVTELFVNNGSNKVEIFAQDFVTQVLLVKEEVLYMRLCIREPADNMAGENLPAPTDTSGEVTALVNPLEDNSNSVIMVCRDTATTAALSSEPSFAPRAAAKGQQVVAKERGERGTVAQRECTSKASSKQPPSTTTGATGKRTVARRTRDDSGGKGGKEEEEGNKKNKGKEKKAGMPASGCGRRPGTDRGLGWGPEAHKSFADNYVSSPGKLMRSRKRQNTAGEKEGVALCCGKRVSPERPSRSRGVETATQQKRRLGWGPEANKYFADNYVSSPGKVLRASRQTRRLAEKRVKEEKVEEKVEEEMETDKRRRLDVSVVDVHSAGPLDSLNRRLVDDESKNGAAAGDSEPRTVPNAQAAVPTPRSLGDDPSHERQVRQGEAGTVWSPIIVERQLNYDIADDIVCTPEEQSTRVLPEKKPGAVGTQRLPPPGWGKDALRYFDAETYFDDPRKANLSPDILSRPIRARRNIVFPPDFSSIFD